MIIWTVNYIHLYIAFTTWIQIDLLHGGNLYKKEKNPISYPHVLRPLHFRHRIKALLRPSTNANLCYLRFDLTNWSWGKNCQNCISSATRSVEVAKLPQRNPLQYLFQWKGQKSTLSPSFITFSEREPFLRGFLFGLFGLFWSHRCISVSTRWRKQNFSKGSQFDHFPLKFVSLLFQISSLRPKRFPIPPLDSGLQCLNHVILC